MDYAFFGSMQLRYLHFSTMAAFLTLMVVIQILFEEVSGCAPLKPSPTPSPLSTLVGINGSDFPSFKDLLASVLKDDDASELLIGGEDSVAESENVDGSGEEGENSAATVQETTETTEFHITSAVDTCINYQHCHHQSGCGHSGVCVYGYCRCKCIQGSPCHMEAHCFGSPCEDTCETITGKHVECNKENFCARGSQCLMGVCIGGGRLNGGWYEGISCTVFGAKQDCASVGSKGCAFFGNICIRHFNSSHIGRTVDKETCRNGVSSVNGFPSCVSALGHPTECAVRNACKPGAHCGSCKCNDAIADDY